MLALVRYGGTSVARSIDSLLLALDLVRGLFDVFPNYLVSLYPRFCPLLHPPPLSLVAIERYPIAIGSVQCGRAGYTHFTKFSSSLLLALMGGVVGSSVFLPPMESAAPVNVTPSVAMASCV